MWSRPGLEREPPPTVSRLFSYRGDQTQSSVQPQGLELIFQTSEKHQEKKKYIYIKMHQGRVTDHLFCLLYLPNLLYSFI